jgi:hypothetical protein
VTRAAVLSTATTMKGRSRPLATLAFGRLVHLPFGAGRCGVEQVLAVVQVEHR